MTPGLAEKFGAGTSSMRLEDERLVRGRGRYTANYEHADRVLHAAFLRSPHAHANIVAIDIAQAVRLPGVVLVLTGADIQTQGLRPLTFANVLKNANGDMMSPPPRWPLTADRVMYVGDPIAIVVATDREIARSAVEMISVEFEELE